MKVNVKPEGEATATVLAEVIPLPKIETCSNCSKRSTLPRMFLVWDRLFCVACVPNALAVAQLADQIVDALEQLSEESAHFLLDRLIDHFVELRAIEE
jgi:hypothetical protein